jgi:thiol-disulfide isomerase/thioredoxin
MFRAWIAFASLTAIVAAAVSGAADEPAGVTVSEVRAAGLQKAIDDYKGKPVFIDCWATWCAPCVKKFPHLVELHKKYADKGLVCMSISMDKSEDAESYKQDKVMTFLKKQGAAFPNFVLSDPRKDDDALAKILGPDYYIIPYMVLFDRNGKRVWNSTAEKKTTDEQLDKLIEEQLAAKP